MCEICDTGVFLTWSSFVSGVKFHNVTKLSVLSDHTGCKALNCAQKLQKCRILSEKFLFCLSAWHRKLSVIVTSVVPVCDDTVTRMAL